MVVRKRSQYENAMVGNAGLNFAAWQLSRRGWHALPTIRNEEVRALAVVDKNGAGRRWLDPRAYDRDEYREAWDRLGDPNATLPLSLSQNGVRRPKAQSLCGQA